MPRKKKSATVKIATQKIDELSDKTVEEFQRNKYLENLPAMTDVFFKQLIKQAEHGSERAVRILGEVIGLVKGSGFNVQTNIYQQNIEVRQSSENFASIVHRLDEVRRLEIDATAEQKQLEAPSSNGAVDAEFIDIGSNSKTGIQE